MLQDIRYTVRQFVKAPGVMAALRYD